MIRPSPTFQKPTKKPQPQNIACPVPLTRLPLVLPRNNIIQQLLPSSLIIHRHRPDTLLQIKSGSLVAADRRQLLILLLQADIEVTRARHIMVR